MKRLLIILIVLSLPLGGAFSGPIGAASLVLTDSLAFFGLGGEFFAGPFGIGLTLTSFVFEGEDSLHLLYEPGGYIHYYTGNLADTFYILAGLTYLDTAVELSPNRGWPSLVRNGLLNINAGLGYHTFLGTLDRFRFSVEFGPRYVVWTKAEPGNKSGWFFAHALFQIGLVF